MQQTVCCVSCLTAHSLCSYRSHLDTSHTPPLYSHSRHPTHHLSPLVRTCIIFHTLRESPLCYSRLFSRLFFPHSCSHLTGTRPSFSPFVLAAPLVQRPSRSLAGQTSVVRSVPCDAFFFAFAQLHCAHPLVQRPSRSLADTIALVRLSLTV